MEDFRAAGGIAKAIYNNKKWEISFGWEIGAEGKKEFVIYRKHNNFSENDPLKDNDSFEKYGIRNIKIPRSPKNGHVIIMTESDARERIQEGSAFLGENENYPLMKFVMDTKMGEIFEVLYVSNKDSVILYGREGVIKSLIIDKSADFKTSVSEELVEVICD